MPSSYPGALDNLPTGKTNTTAQVTDHPGHHNDLANAVNAVQTALGVNPQGSAATVAARLTALFQVYNVKSYGALGDNSTDDSTAIQAAADAVEAAGGGILYFPPGTYIARGVQVGSNTHLRGAGIGASTLKLKSSSAVVTGVFNDGHRMILTNKGSTGSGANHITVAELEFDGNVTNNHAAEWTSCIEFFGVQKVHVHHCHFRDVRAEGVTVTAQADDTPQNEDIFITDCSIENAGFTTGGSGNSRQGFAVIAANRVVIDRITAKTVASYIVDLEPDSSSHTIRNFTVSNIVGHDCTNGVAAYGQATNTVTDGRISNVSLRDGSNTALDQGVVLGYTNRVTINGLSGDVPFGNQAVHLIHATDTIITGVQSLDAGRAGVFIEDSDLTFITGNELRCTTNDQNYAIEESGTCTYTIALSNLLENGPLGTVKITGAGGYSDNPGSINLASASTISIPRNVTLVNVSGTTNIGTINVNQAAHLVVLKFAGILTVTDGANQKLNGNFVSTADDTLTLISDGSAWYEVARSVN